MTVTTLQLKIVASTVLALGIFAGGLWTGKQVWKPKIAQVIPQAQINLAGGAVIAPVRVDPGAKPLIPQVPAGYKVLRQGQVFVSPGATETNGANPPAIPKIDWELLGDPQGNERFAVASPDGQIEAVTDVVVSGPPSAPVIRPNALGASWDPANGTYGVWYSRDWHLIRAGVEVDQIRVSGNTTLAATVKLGIIF